MTAKGVIFATIEDEHGQGNVVVYAYIAQRRRVALPTSGLLVVEGREEREDQHSAVPLVHLVASRLTDRSDLLRRLVTIDESGTEGTEPGLEVRMPAIGSMDMEFRVNWPSARTPWG